MSKRLYKTRHEAYQAHWQRRKLKLTPEKRDQLRLYHIQWRKLNHERYCQSQSKYRHQRKLKVLKAYGNQCICCGEKRHEFLAIDHVSGNGRQHRISIHGHIHEWLFKHKFPKGFRILCHNCNQSIGSYGYCPHNVTL